MFCFADSETIPILQMEIVQKIIDNIRPGSANPFRIFRTIRRMIYTKGFIWKIHPVL